MKDDISKTGFFHSSLDKDISQKVSSPHFWPLDDLPGQVNVLQPEVLVLLPVFRLTD